MRSSHDGERMKTSIKLLTVIAVLALAVIPLVAVDGSDADVIRNGQWEASGFTDYDAGRIRVTLINDSTEAMEIKLVACETGDHDNVYDTKTVTVPGTDTDGGRLAVELSWKFGSSGTKYVDVIAFDPATDKEITKEQMASIQLLNENNVTIEVTHSIWKNSVTYIVIAVIIIIVVIVIIMYIRSSKKTKADTTMADKTFTKMHNEKMGRKTAAAQKTEYKSSGKKTRKK